MSSSNHHDNDDDQPGPGCRPTLEAPDRGGGGSGEINGNSTENSGTDATSSSGSCTSISTTTSSCNNSRRDCKNSNDSCTSSCDSDNGHENQLQFRHQLCQKSTSQAEIDCFNPNASPQQVSNTNIDDRLRAVASSSSQVVAEVVKKCDNKNITEVVGSLNSSASNSKCSDEQQATTSKQILNRVIDTQNHNHSSNLGEESKVNNDPSENSERLNKYSNEQKSHDNNESSTNQQSSTELYRSENLSLLLSNLSTTKSTSIGSTSYSNLSSNITNSKIGLSSSNKIDEPSITRRILKPAPSPSPSLSTIDTNNNKNKSTNNVIKDSLSSLKRSNFSKSASGGRLIKDVSRPTVCDCLTPDCKEKKHSNRRHFIEHYYNSRTQLPSATSSSSFNINTPLNRLSECDAITKRLLSSPIRTVASQIESPTKRAQVTEVDKSRRASLGTSTMTDQVFLFSSNPFKSLELGFKRMAGQKTTLAKEEEHKDQTKQGICCTKIITSNDMKPATQQSQNQQQPAHQGRSLSVCDEEALNPRIRSFNLNHSTNLNRAISLASESRSSQADRRLLTIIPLFGCDIKTLEQFSKLGVVLPPVIDSIVNYILINGIKSVGIFRKSGVKSRILILRQRIEANQNLNFCELNQNKEFSIYDIADLVKMWFRELKPLPLMTKDIIKVISSFLNNSQPHQQTTSLVLKHGNTSQQESAISSTTKQFDSNLRNSIDSMTTQTHRALLAKALQFLAQISSQCNVNQMTSQNLSICLTPSLCATETHQNSILMAQKALEYCIDNHEQLFG